MNGAELMLIDWSKKNSTNQPSSYIVNLLRIIHIVVILIQSKLTSISWLSNFQNIKAKLQYCEYTWEPPTQRPCWVRQNNWKRGHNQEHTQFRNIAVGSLLNNLISLPVIPFWDPFSTKTWACRLNRHMHLIYVHYL